MDAMPTWLFLLAAGAIGLELGGLATVFISRWIAERPLLRPARSVCPSCGAGLGWRETIPLLSYLLLRGRCRHCGAPIGGQYLLVELSCLAWSLALAHHLGPGLAYAVRLVLGCMLIAGSFIDIETGLLPNRITVGGTVLALAAGLVLDSPGWSQAALGAACGGGFLWMVQQGYRAVAGREGVGSGDVKLLAMVGAMTGLDRLPLTILVAVLSAGLALALPRPGRRRGQDRVPFGPFLSLGCMVAVLYGREIMAWWSGL